MALFSLILTSCNTNFGRIRHALLKYSFGRAYGYIFKDFFLNYKLSRWVSVTETAISKNIVQKKKI